jgi:nucleoside-diphosphate-sugar epimerase
VYRAYGCLLGLEEGPPATAPFDEDSPLRTALYPYRDGCKEPSDLAFNYEKILVEHAVMSDAQLPGTILRLPAVYGPGDHSHRMSEYLKRVDDGRRVILFGQAHAQWRWTRGYVENVADAIALVVADDRAAGRIYNVGEPVALGEAEWARAIGKAAGWQGEVVVMPDEELPAHLRAPYHYEHHLECDTSRIRAELEYAERIAQSDAIAATVAWERANPPDRIDAERFDYAAEDAALARRNSSANAD